MENYTQKFEFEKESFAKGRFRRAFKGKWTYPPNKAGDQVVVKEMSATYMWEPTSWDTSLKVHRTAADLAKKFTSSVHPARDITFAEVTKGIITKQCDPSATPKVNEYVMVEEYLPGEFTKWCNNFGYVKQVATGQHNLLPAFMHWTWAHTKGEMMVSDLQGVFSDGRYRLTDPAIMSLDGNFGPTDTSVDGIIMFFFVHECTHITCRDLPTPTVMDFAKVIPDKDIKAAYQKVREIGSSTTYRAELTFSESNRSKAKDVLRKVGQNK